MILDLWAFIRITQCIWLTSLGVFRGRLGSSLKELMSQTPVLGFLNFSKPFFFTPMLQTLELEQF